MPCAPGSASSSRRPRAARGARRRDAGSTTPCARATPSRRSRGSFSAACRRSWRGTASRPIRGSTPDKSSASTCTRTTRPERSGRGAPSGIIPAGRDEPMGFLAGKRAFIVGVATDRSMAWGSAQARHREGAELAFSYLNDKMKERVEPLAHSLGSRLTLPLDVTVEGQIDAAFGLLKREWGELDIVVHAVAYAPREALTGTFLEATTREGSRIAHDVSSYSLTALAQRAAPLMAGRNAALLTLTYLGAVRSIPGYNVMGLAKASLEANVRFLAADLGPKGVRVNAISAGPIKTLAAAGIPGFRKMLARVAEVAPLRRNVSLEDVGNAAAFLCSDLAAGITGEILYVDSGFSTVGMSFPLEAEG